MSGEPDISVIVACFDEEEALPALFSELNSLAAAAGGRRVEEVFVDDGSRDGTRAMLLARAAGGPDRRVVIHAANLGFGAAMRSGLSAASGRAVVVYDADATYPVLDVLKLAGALEDSDAAGASPFAAGGEAAATPFRRLLSRAAAGLYRLALRGRGRGVTALTCAFRAYRRDVLPRMAFRADGFLAAAESLCLILSAGLRYRELPSRLTARRHGRSKMRAARVAAGHLGLVLSVFLRRGAFHARTRARRVTIRAEAPADLRAWNVALNRDHPMERIDRHGNPVVRLMEGRRRRRVVMLLAPRRGQAVLDVGAERGGLAARLAATGAVRVPLDIDRAVLGGEGVAADAQRLPFRDGAFPRVLLSEVLEHCPDPAAAAREAARVVAVSGRVAFSVPDDRLVTGAKRLLSRLGLGAFFRGLPAGAAPGHLHAFTRDSLREVLAAGGRLVSLAHDPASAAFFAVLARRPEEA